jgi:hypothetical protein
MADQAAGIASEEGTNVAANAVPAEADASAAPGKRSAEDDVEAPAAKRVKVETVTASESGQAAGAGGDGVGAVKEEGGAVKVEDSFENVEGELEVEEGDGERVLKKPVQLGPKEFYSPTVTYNYFRDLLKFWGREVDINEVSAFCPFLTFSRLQSRQQLFPSWFWNRCRSLYLKQTRSVCYFWMARVVERPDAFLNCYLQIRVFWVQL